MSNNQSKLPLSPKTATQIRLEIFEKTGIKVDANDEFILLILGNLSILEESRSNLERVGDDAVNRLDDLFQTRIKEIGQLLNALEARKEDIARELNAKASLTAKDAFKGELEATLNRHMLKINQSKQSPKGNQLYIWGGVGLAFIFLTILMISWLPSA